MRQSEALSIFNYWDDQGRHVYRKRDLAVIFNEPQRTFDNSLRRLVKSGILERVAHGVYVYTSSSHRGFGTLYHIARNLRRGDLTYESLESALSQYGVISQIPIDRITLMTTGRSGEYVTPYGVIEFTHTKTPFEEILPHLIDHEDRVLPIATKHYAYRNLRSVGRNLDLVDEEVLDEED